MAEVTQVMFTHEELTKLLIKHQNFHEGYWRLIVSFGFGAGNAKTEQSGEINPMAFVAVSSLGIQKANEGEPFAYDAAKVNPMPAAE